MKDADQLVIILAIAIFMIINGFLIYIVIKLNMEEKKKTSTEVQQAENDIASRLVNPGIYTDDIRKVQSNANEQQYKNAIPNYNPDRRLNIETRPQSGGSTSYNHIGIITSIDGSKIYNLYGKQTYGSSLKWNYYSLNDGYNPIRLTVQSGGKDCMEEYGCLELYDKDQIVVEETGETFDVKIYKDADNRLVYIP
jgi:flagellar basal body-associated protein FliL